MAKILISYRRADSAAIVGRIYDRLAARYGRDSIFLDIDNIPVGVDFRDRLRGTIEKSDVLIAVVGPRWAGDDGAGHARIRDRDDPVRVEIEIASEAGVPLCPVLVGGAKMPAESDLPPSLAKFPYLHASTVDAGLDFENHVARLIASLDGMLGLEAPPPKRDLQVRAIVAFVVAAGLPLAAWAFGIAPPWPPGAAFATAVLALASVALVRRLLRLSRHVTVVRAASAAGLVLALAGCAYLFANSVYVYAVPDTKVRLAKGYICTPEAQLLYKEKCPSLGLDELRGAEYEAGRLWTAQSIAAVQIALDGLWLVAFVALAALVATGSPELQSAGARS